MVYCGKPSRGCQMCRQRRIKCDEGKPTCHQCQKSRRVCPGYKDDFDLIFRNETQATERRARKAGTGKRPGSQTIPGTHTRNAEESESSGNMQLVTFSGEDIPPTPVQNALVLPLATRAANFFLSNFVLIPQTGTKRAWMDYIVPLIKTEPSNSPLQSAFAAVSLASLGNRPNAKSLLALAGEQYTRALRQVNIALRDPVVQKTDATLAAVLLLGLFEVVTSKRQATSAWGSHIQGAVMLVKLRGRKQLKTSIGQSLFHSIRTLMTINCLATSKHPDLGIDWWLTDAVRDEHSHKVTKLQLMVTDLRAEVNDVMTLLPRTPANIQRVTGLLRRSQEMEKEFAAFVESVPEEWKYETVAWHDEEGDLMHDEVCPGKVDLYTDIFIVSVWNNLRISRLLLGGSIIRCAAWLCHPVDYRTTPEYASQSRLGADMITDICASMPFSLGWKLARNGTSVDVGMHARYACGDDGNDSSKGLGGYMAMWPLFSSSCSDFASDMQRKWMVGRLNYISDFIGIDQAKTFAHFQLRLPSMIVKRDGLGLAQQKAKAAGIPLSALLKGAVPPFSNPASQGTSSYPAQPSTAYNAMYSSFSNYTTSASPSVAPSGVATSNVAPPYYQSSVSPPHQTISPPNSDHIRGYSPEATNPTSKVYDQIQQYNEHQRRQSSSSHLSFSPETAAPSAEYPRSTSYVDVPYSSGYVATPIQEKDPWQSAENERAERERLAKDLERRRREEALEREKLELVKAAAGGEGGTDDMKQMMSRYLAVDKVSLGY